MESAVTRCYTPILLSIPNDQPTYSLEKRTAEPKSVSLLCFSLLKIVQKSKHRENPSVRFALAVSDVNLKGTGVGSMAPRKYIPC